MDILNRLISYLFFSIFSTTISRIFVVCGVSIEFEKTRLDCKKKRNPKKPPKIQKQKYLTLKKVVEDATFHIIIQYCKYLKKKNNDILQIWFSRFSKHVFQFLLCEPEGNDPLLEQAWTLSIHGCFVKK